MRIQSTQRVPALAGLYAAMVIWGAAYGTGAFAADLPNGSPESVGMSSERLDRLDTVMHGWVDEGRIAGVVTLVARRGRVVHLDAYGMADIEHGERMREGTYFRLFSMTKPITSVALLTLYEEGKFQLSDRLSQYLPEFADVKVFAGVNGSGGMILADPDRAPTMADVFRHTAGFSYGSGPEPVQALYQQADLYGSRSLEELASKLAGIPLIYQPGTQWVYSFSHDVQARLVEVLSGQPFADYVRERIFEPLGMDDVVFGLPRRLAGRFANTYSPDANGKLMASDTPEDTAYDTAPFGGTSLAGTVTDYARFAQMLANSGRLGDAQILSPKTVDLMDSNHLPEGVYRLGPGGAISRGEGYGLGVRVVTDGAAAGNLTSTGTFGWSGAAGTHFIVDRSEDLIALFMIQRQGQGAGGMSSEFETMVYQAIVD
jgi:CubicO group peptidase (beta-lactamase class C family)